MLPRARFHKDGGGGGVWVPPSKIPPPPHQTYLKIIFLGLEVNLDQNANTFKLLRGQG